MKPTVPSLAGLSQNANSPVVRQLPASFLPFRALRLKR